MAKDLALETDTSLRATGTWWAARRSRYNLGLLVAGPLGFLFYAVAVSRCFNLNASGDWEITIFTTLFQAFAYLVIMGIANLCYYLGPWSEQFLRPAKVAKYRKIAFRLGFWFSVLLPFMPSATLFVFCSGPAGRSPSTPLTLG